MVATRATAFSRDAALLPSSRATAASRASRRESGRGRRGARTTHCASNPGTPASVPKVGSATPRREERSSSLVEARATTAFPSTSVGGEREERRPVIALPGGGIYFYWNAGVLQYLGERYDLEGCELLGASAGALAVVLVACGIDFKGATKVAFRLAEENGLYDRRLALVGIWGRLVR